MGKVKRILIQGIGGIGGTLSAGLIKSGYAVTLITGNEKIARSINENGVRIYRGDEMVAFYATAHTSLEELPRTARFDISLMLMKATKLQEALAATLPFLKHDGYVVAFQNGLVMPVIQDTIGRDRVIRAIVGYGGIMIEPGVYRRITTGALHIGEFSGYKTPRIAELKSILSTAEEVVVTKNITGVIWSKLALNCSINTIGAITGFKLGEMLKYRDIRKIVIASYREVVNLAEAQSIELERIAVNPYLLYISEDANFVKRWFKDKIVRMVGFRYRNSKASTLQSLERGRKTEVDFINGQVVKIAQKMGIEVPFNSMLLETLHEIEDGKREINRDNVRHILSTV